MQLACSRYDLTVESGVEGDKRFSVERPTDLLCLLGKGRGVLHVLVPDAVNLDDPPRDHVSRPKEALVDHLSPHVDNGQFDCFHV